MFKVGEEVDNLGLRWKCKVCGCDNVKIIHQIKDEYNVECINPKCKHKEIISKDLKFVTPKPFTKSDLKDGMNCVDREGSRYIVFNDKLMHESNPIKEPLENYEDDLTYSIGEWNRYDIMKVIDQGNVVFDREEEQEPTVEQRLEFDNAVSDLLSEYYETSKLEVLVKVGQTIIDFIDKHYELEDEEEIRPEVSL